MTQREMERGIHTDLSRRENYSAYLQLEQLLSSQTPLSDPAHHDEMLFIVQHQVAELWMKLLIHEFEAAMDFMRQGRLKRASKCLARAKKVQQQLHNQWGVLDTLTPSEYAEFRHVFGNASGFQSPQYRMLEILLGVRNRKMLKVYEHRPEWHARLSEALDRPGVFDEFLSWLARCGHSVPESVLDRDFSEPRGVDDGVVRVLLRIYRNTREHWDAYEVCETLVDIANNFQFWRFRHLKTVERIIGHRPGSGGSSGVSFLRRALDQEFFEELIAVRTALHADSLSSPTN
ncbi:MAG: tryptophan 2,3-dioxygenase family protein [Pseudomonadota bacterium]